jgi:hypothetical protein
MWHFASLQSLAAAIQTVNDPEQSTQVKEHYRTDYRAAEQSDLLGATRNTPSVNKPPLDKNHAPNKHKIDGTSPHSSTTLAKHTTSIKSSVQQAHSKPNTHLRGPSYDGPNSFRPPMGRHAAGVVSHSVRT